jgi:hypothetical protein
VLTRRLLLGHWPTYELTEKYGITSLDDLTKWSAGELMSLQNFGATKVGHIEAAMAKFGLSLRSDGERIEHEYCAKWNAEQEEADKYHREQQAEQLANDWAKRDREYILGQARAVASIWYRAHKLLKENRDDPAAFALIARALQKSPPIANPVYHDLERIEEAEKSEAARAADMEEAAKARDAANRRIAELVREAGTDGNVIAFPVAAMRAIPQIGGVS